MKKDQKESLALRFLYQTIPGRMMLRILISPWISQSAGKVLDSRYSAGLIPFFTRMCNISVKDMEIPEQGFPSFNAFFCRNRINRGNFIPSDKILYAPCDGYLCRIPIWENTIYDIKHTKFTLEELLKDRKLARKFYGGTALVFRLCPEHFHRYSFAANSKVMAARRIPGIFHCVRPIATEKYRVYAENTREYQIMKSDEFGYLVQMEIGALLIGRISNLPLQDKNVKAGKEKGYFEYGGSTVVVLIQKGKAEFYKNIEKELFDGREISIREGTKICFSKG